MKTIVSIGIVLFLTAVLFFGQSSLMASTSWAINALVLEDTTLYRDYNDPCGNIKHSPIKASTQEWIKVVHVPV